MTAISILHAIVASAANPLKKTNSDPEQSSPASESVFKGELDVAIQSWVKGETKDATQGHASDDDPRETAAKNEERPQLPILVTVIATILPAPLPAGFGLPAAGLEPGLNNGGASNQAEAIANAELPATAPDDKTAQTAAAAQSDPQADLAFALRLGSPAPKDVGVEQARPALAMVQSDPVQVTTPAKCPAPEAPPRPGPDVRPATEIPPGRATMVSPPVLRIVPQNGTAVESEPNQSNDAPTDKKPPGRSLNPAPPRPTGPAQPEVEMKPGHESDPTPAPSNSTPKEIPLPMPGPSHTAAVSLSNTSMPPPSASVAAAPAAVRNNPTSEVTDVSVSLPVPRADSTGEDRVAIRVVQKGAEIHVSVRTPDNQLSQTLRQDLGRLATGLDEAGFRTEIWRPVVTGVAAPSQSSASQESSQGAPNRDNSGSDAPSSGRQGHNPGEQKRRQQDQRPRWVAELEQYKNQQLEKKQWQL